MVAVLLAVGVVSEGWSLRRLAALAAFVLFMTQLEVLQFLAAELPPFLRSSQFLFVALVIVLCALSYLVPAYFVYPRAFRRFEFGSETG